MWFWRSFIKAEKINRKRVGPPRNPQMNLFIVWFKLNSTSQNSSGLTLTPELCPRTQQTNTIGHCVAYDPWHHQVNKTRVLLLSNSLLFTAAAWGLQQLLGSPSLFCSMSCSSLTSVWPAQSRLLHLTFSSTAATLSPLSVCSFLLSSFHIHHAVPAAVFLFSPHLYIVPLVRLHIVCFHFYYMLNKCLNIPAGLFNGTQ